MKHLLGITENFSTIAWKKLVKCPQCFIRTIPHLLEFSFKVAAGPQMFSGTDKLLSLNYLSFPNTRDAPYACILQMSEYEKGKQKL